VIVGRSFALLVKSIQWNRKIQWRKSCRRMLTLFELFGAVFLFIPFPHLFLALHPQPWVFSNYTCIVLFQAFVRFPQNHSRKVLNREALRLCKGSWYSNIWQKIHWFIVFHSSIWGLRNTLVWAKPTKALWRRKRLPTDIYFKNGITKPCQIHQNGSNIFSKLFL